MFQEILSQKLVVLINFPTCHTSKILVASLGSTMTPLHFLMFALVGILISCTCPLDGQNTIFAATHPSHMSPCVNPLLGPFFIGP